MKKLLLLLVLVCAIFANDTEKINQFKICIDMKLLTCGMAEHCGELLKFAHELHEAKVKTIPELKEIVAPYKRNPEVKCCYDHYIK